MSLQMNILESLPVRLAAAKQRIAELEQQRDAYARIIKKLQSRLLAEVTKK